MYQDDDSFSQDWQRYEYEHCPCDGELDRLSDGVAVCPDCKAVYDSDIELAQAWREHAAERDAEERAGMLRDCGIW